MMPTSKYSGTVKSGTSASVMAAAVAVTNTQRLSQPFINAVDPCGKPLASRCIDIELCSDETGFNRFSSLKMKDPLLVTRSTQTVAIATTANEQPSLLSTTNGMPANNNNNISPTSWAPIFDCGSAANANMSSSFCDATNGVSSGINMLQTGYKCC
ncbi:hypothetical protein LSTR_LSTR016870 [Laodelphax striatellus]|uniref:Uncharacterized protein n=1 Tax=Laodelphax striatellus TaxID=195883 RepID=A0A482WKR1_LAOST|nr:hypothetical protein LSTR_LSTR016870 [Laodelphax striatellus]